MNRTRGRFSPHAALALSVAAVVALATAAWSAVPAGHDHEHAAHEGHDHGEHAKHGHEAKDPDSGAEMIGEPAPAWNFDRWIRSEPLSLEDVRGKVVLMRWWTEGCRFCTATLPVVERARRAYPNDLVTVGVFHPKPPRPVRDEHVLKVAKKLGYEGAIAVDETWKGLDRYWLEGHPERNWTSISFLLDREGNVRWVHGGGEFHPNDDPRHARCDIQNDEFEAMLKTLLAERPQVP